MADLSADIASQAVEPVSVTADGQSSTARPIGDLIKADQYGATKTAARKRRRGVFFTQLTTPGALDDSGRTGSDGGCG